MDYADFIAAKSQEASGYGFTADALPDHLTPFMGVGSEVYTAVQMDRYGIGVELKTSYYRQALANLEAAATDRDSSSPAMLDVVLP